MKEINCQIDLLHGQFRLDYLIYACVKLKIKTRFVNNDF